MDAANSVDVVIDGSKALRNEVAAVLTAFEQITGLRVCLKLMSARWRDINGVDVVPQRFVGHYSPFCQAVKARSFAACKKSDRGDLPSVCSAPEGRVVDPFVRTCHAGADEVLLPLWSEGVLVGVLLLGQFTRQHSDPRWPSPLRHVSDPDVQHLRTSTLTLRSYLLDVLHRLDGQRQQPGAGRRGVIEAYIRERLSVGPALPELASRLSLSRSRASHLVRELTGRSFQGLVDEHRIAVAKDLLASSDGTVAWVGHQIGFHDTAYFCRYFKRKTGTTPTTFREQYRRALPV